MYKYVNLATPLVISCSIVIIIIIVFYFLRGGGFCNLFINIVILYETYSVLNRSKLYEYNCAQSLFNVLDVFN